MWLRKISEDFKSNKSEIFNLNFLWNQDNVYVMDNHLAAAYCWLQQCDDNGVYNFLHIDQHNDFLCDAPICEYAEILKEKICSIDDYCSKIYKNNLPLMRWDNYIKPTQILHPSWFKNNIFSTHCNHDDVYVRNLEPSMEIMRVKPENLCEQLNSIFQMDENKWIVNIDLDFFFSASGYILCNDECIVNCAEKLRQNMERIQVLTISLSPECCGNYSIEGWENSIRVLNLFIQALQILDKDAPLFPADYI